MFVNVLIRLLRIFGVIVSVIVVFVLLNSLFRLIKHKLKTGDTFKESFVNVRFLTYVDALKWIIIDLSRGKDYLRLYGLWAFTGYYGEGKTLGCVLYANNLQKKYPEKDIKIYSNIEVKGQVKRLASWKELLDLPPNSIFIYDESQSDFGSTNLGVRDFPPDLLRKLTQVRKRSLAIFATTPIYTRMNINMRESVHFVVESNNIGKFDRLFNYRFYHAAEYERVIDNPDRKIKEALLFTETFAVSDSDFDLYDSLEEVDSIIEPDIEIKGRRSRDMINDRLSDFENDMVKRVEGMIRKNNYRNSQ